MHEQVRTQTDYQCRHIWYLSDGIPVSGYLWKPKDLKGDAWPSILFARGGTGEFGLIDNLILADLYLLARQGYVVLTTDYRSVGERGRRDEVHDVLNLVAVAKTLGYVDLDKLFLLGMSRGGMMTYMALKAKIPVKAAAVIAGVAVVAPDRPDFVNGDEYYDGFRKVWPDYEHRKDEYFRDLSAVAWAGQINTPVLILHSRIDKKVAVSQAFAIAEKLQEHRKEYELVIYSNDGHSLPLHRADRNQHILSWFRDHDKRQKNNNERDKSESGCAMTRRTAVEIFGAALAMRLEEAEGAGSALKPPPGYSVMNMDGLRHVCPINRSRLPC